jgi:hypothetical protein
VSNDNYVGNTASGNYQLNQWCSRCGAQYYGYHVCSIYPNYYPQYTYYWPMATTQQTNLEAKPKYEAHTLDCGCEVETKVVKHCDTLHKAPEEE